MTLERGLSYADNQSLVPIMDKTPMLERRGSRIVCPEKIDVPLDEYGIPRRVQLMRRVLDTMETQHIWTGGYDVHHMAWPGVWYRKLLDEDDGMFGSAYRGAGSLKVRLPRQLHNYVHTISEPPPMPDEEIIKQYALEHGQVSRLYDAIKLTSYEDFPELAALPFQNQERLRQESYERKLESMADGEIGLMPDTEYLAALTIAQARPVLRALVTVHGLSNAKKSKRQFFAGDQFAA